MNVIIFIIIVLSSNRNRLLRSSKRPNLGCMLSFWLFILQLLFESEAQKSRLSKYRLPVFILIAYLWIKASTMTLVDHWRKKEIQLAAKLDTNSTNSSRLPATVGKALDSVGILIWKHHRNKSPIIENNFGYVNL